MTVIGDERARWDDLAGWWQEQFTDGVDPEYEEQILPIAEEALQGSRLVLDVGCGEGQVSRRVSATGARVIGVDLSVEQIVEAARRQGGPHYAQAPAHALPFADATFDAVVVCLMLEHIDVLEPVLAEFARVLEPGGRLIVFLNHPLLQTKDAAWVIDYNFEPPERSWRIGPYLHEGSFVDQVEKGVFVRFVHRPLSRYVNGLLDAGFALTRMEEPAPPEGFIAIAEEYREQAAIPRLLVLRATKGA